MAEPEIILPVLRERAVYISDIGNGQDGANYINRSFKGILRLSPNDSNTYLEQPEDTPYTSVAQDYVNYNDKIYDVIQNQFLKVSTSDGYFLDMRISVQGVEYTKLYITGAFKTYPSETSSGAVQIFSNNDDYALHIGASSINSSYNRLDDYRIKNESQYIPLTLDTLDDSYFLMNTGSADGTMEFINSRTILEELIENALMKLGTVPTGSIQFVPVNLTQYKALLDKSANAAGGHNIDSANNDTLIRDYLLCDGSYYRVEDYPELAKMLYKEQITYWAPSESDVTNNTTDKKYKKYIEKSGNITTLNDFVDNTGTSSSQRVFRVPDLRAQFIQSVVPKLELSELKDENGNLINAPGSYEIDSMRDAKLSIENGEDNHYHYIVLDTNGTNQHNTHFTNEIIDYVEICNNETDSFAKLLTSSPAAMARYGAIGPRGRAVWARPSDGCPGKCCKQCYYNPAHAIMGDARYQAFTSPVYAASITVSHCVAGSCGGGYILSTITKDELDNITDNQWIGVSSWPIDMSASDDEIKNLTDNNLNYTTDDNDNIYHNSKDYVEYDDSMKQMIGYENTPEFYAVLPLIKI